MAGIGNLTRPEMKRIGREILTLLQERAAKGPEEKPLDELMAELEAVVVALETGVDGQGAAAAALKAILAKLEAADVDVDTWLRHHYYFIHVEASRRSGANVGAAQALEAAAFPDGLAHVDDYIPDENSLCRESIAVLRHPDHAAAVAAIGLPTAWIDAWATAVDVSEAAFKQAQEARGGKSVHVVAGQDAQVAFIDVMTRLKGYIGIRAARTDTVKIAQGQLLIQPLLTELTKMRAAEKTRETKKKAQKDKPAPAPAPVVVTAPAVPNAPSPATPATPAAPTPAPTDGGE